jgi:hypothetical protein
MKADYVHKDTLTATDYVELNKNNELLMSYNQVLLKENQKLKKQLEEKDILIKQCELSVSNVMDCYCERTDCSGRIKDSKKYDSLVQVQETQQKEFIKWLESVKFIGIIPIEMVCDKYKEIIGVSDEKTN